MVRALGAVSGAPGGLNGCLSSRRGNWIVAGLASPFLVAAFTVSLLNAAWLVQRRRIDRQAWDQRFIRELQAWDGRLPAEFEQPPS